MVNGVLTRREGDLVANAWYSKPLRGAAVPVNSRETFHFATGPKRQAKLATARAGLNASRPNLMSFLARIHARPAYQSALSRGGKYAYAG